MDIEVNCDGNTVWIKHPGSVKDQVRPESVSMDFETFQRVVQFVQMHKESLAKLAAVFQPNRTEGGV